VADQHSVPVLPLIPPPQPQGLLCCGVEYSQQRKRCGLCRKWKAGKRENFKRRPKKQKLFEQEAGLAEPYPTPTKGGGKGKGRPTDVVTLPVTGVEMQNLSPMTGTSNRPRIGDDVTNDDDTIDTNGTMETLDNDDIDALIRDDNVNKGDGGDSDAEGDGYYIANEFAGAMHISKVDQMQNDRSEIEAAVEANDENAIMAESNGDDEAVESLRE
jgi:hypothetical protein